MEFAKRIGELAQITRRLSRVQAEKSRAQRQLTSSHSALPPLDGDEHGAVSLTLRRQRDAAQASRTTLARCTREQNRLLLRRIPVAVSAVERSWAKLHHKQRERQKLMTHRALESNTHSRATATEGDGVARQVPSTADSEASTQLVTPLTSRGAEGRQRHDTREENAGGDSGQWALLQHLPDGGLPTPLSSPSADNRRSGWPASHQEVEAVFLLLQLFHSLEHARRQHLGDRQAAAVQRRDRAEAAWRGFQKEFAAQLHPRRQRGRPSTSDTLTAEEEALLKETAATLQQRRRIAAEEARLLQSSLLSRPFVSARLWRRFLGESVWVTAVVEHREATVPSPARSTAAPRDPTRLLLLCLALSRIAMGVLRDYVNGGTVNRTSPRFVVSLPSRAYRARHSGAGDGSVTANAREGDEGRSRVDGTAAAAAAETATEEMDDPLMAMLQSAERESEAAVTPHRKRRVGGSRKQGLRMRWLPPHTADVLPLAVDTLAMHSLVLPELNLTALLRAGCAAELIGLCVTLQSIATTTLALTGEGDAISRPLHRTLPVLERALTHVGGAVVAHLTQERSSNGSSDRAGEKEADGYAGKSPRSTPEEAARLAVQLNALRLLPQGTPATAQLLTQVLLDMFPELRTQTAGVLQEKARQSSLLAFATRRHRQKLYQQHGRHHAESYLLETVVQQARLQQRQLAAALRDQRMTEVHVQALSALGQAVSASDLIQLFQLYARNASAQWSGEESATDTAEADTWLTGSLFLAETILLAGHLRHDSAAAAPFSLEEVAALWDAAALLFPHIRTRRARQLARQRAMAGAQRSRSKAAAAAHTESIIWATLAEHLVSSLSAALAERLQALAERRAGESTGMRRGGASVALGPTVPVNALVAMVAGTLEYAAHDASLRQGDGDPLRTHASSSLQPVQQSVRTLVHLLRQLVLHDRELWHRVRRLPPVQREAVEGQLRECLHTVGALDEATTRALGELNRSDGIAV